MEKGKKTFGGMAGLSPLYMRGALRPLDALEYSTGFHENFFRNHWPRPGHVPHAEGASAAFDHYIALT